MFRRIALLLALCLAAAPAAAGCQAEYKAKQDNPLRLDYGVIDVPDNQCTQAAAQDYVRNVLAARGWILLSILSVRKTN